MGRIFVSYAHADKKRLSDIQTHFAPLETEHHIELWTDQAIPAGSDWEPTLLKQLGTADAAILLVSPGFLASSFIQSVEIPKLLERRQRHGVPVWPLIIEPCSWKLVPWLKTMQLRPAEAQPLWSMPKPKRQKTLSAFVNEIYAQLKLPAKSPQKLIVAELLADLDHTSLSRSELVDLVDRIRMSLGPDTPATVKRVKPGSVRLFIELTEAQLEQLRLLLRKNMLDSDVLTIQGVLSEHERKQLELFEFRSEIVVRDETVAELFDVPVKALNQAVKRNADRFDERYVFQLNEEEWSDLRSQTVTTKTGRGGRRSSPWMFTQRGVVLAATILRSSKAVEASHLLVDVFLAARQQGWNSVAGSETGRAIIDGSDLFEN